MHTRRHDTPGGGRLRLLVLVPVLAALVAPVGAGYYEGLAAFESGRLEIALREWLPLAEQGDLEVQFRVARLYHRGEAVHDPVAALEWYRRAAERGHPEAENNIGSMLEQGMGAAADVEEAARWYRRAADHGLAVAQTNLGRLVLEGLGVEPDAERAEQLFLRAARQGSPEAQYRLGSMYADGAGIERDEKAAAKWLRRAARNGHTGAETRLSRLRTEGRWVPGEPSPPTPAPAAPASSPTAPASPSDDSRGRPPLTTHAGPQAIYEQARSHEIGRGVEVDPAEAARLYLEAARDDHPLAAYRLALLHLRGRGVERDPFEAYRWFAVCARRGVGDAAQWIERIENGMSAAEIARARALARQDP